MTERIITVYCLSFHFLKTILLDKASDNLQLCSYIIQVNTKHMYLINNVDLQFIMWNHTFILVL